MRRWLLWGYLGLTAFVLAILVIPLGIVSARAERDRLNIAVERDATVMAGLAEDALDQGTPADLQGIVSRYHERTGGRVVITDRDGLSVGDSDQPPGRDYGTRPEFQSALRGEVAIGARYSETLREGLTYVAVPVASGGRVHGAVRVTFPTADVDARIRRTWVTLALVSLVVLAAATLLSLVLARMMTRPVALLTARTREMADLWHAVPVAPQGPEELRVLAQSFNLMAARLSDLLASQETFVADASHQLRSPLAALRLRLENLEPLVPTAAADELNGAIAETRRLSQLVEGLLALTRASGGAAVPTTIDLAAVVADREGTWGPLADEQAVHLVSDVQPVWIRAVAGTAEQVLDNLIANALGVAPAGTTLTLSARRSGREAVVHVTDEGPGMTPEERQRAFDRFWRGNHPERPDGFGLGLAIVRRLVTTSGGDVRLHEAAGGGLDVEVRWPAESASAGAAVSPDDVQIRTGISK